MNLKAHLTRQAVFSRATFGPSARTKGVCEHIRSELKEIEDVYENPDKYARVLGTRTTEDGITEVLRDDPNDHDTHTAAAAEWTDVAILGLDGLLRAIAAANPTWTFDLVAEEAVERIVAKQGKNELRDWPDWRQSGPDEAIEHVRGKHD